VFSSVPHFLDTLSPFYYPHLTTVTLPPVPNPGIKPSHETYKFPEFSTMSTSYLCLDSDSYFILDNGNGLNVSKILEASGDK